MTIIRQGELRTDELNEFPIRAPFGGIQSQIPLDIVERIGFDNASNVILRNSVVAPRPGRTSLPVLPPPINEAVNGIANFFASNGTRVQVIITPTRMLKWDGGSSTWTPITGTLTGSVSNLFHWTVVANKLLFSQGIDKVKSWDGISASFADVSVNAVPAKFMMELGFHLIVGHTIEAGNLQHQRVRWTGIGDPTDWTSFGAGQTDLFNDLGPITGMTKLFQSGYIWQQLGITQVLPTGFGLRPFDFAPLSAHSKGNICPNSLASFGETIACYVGKDNIYSFDGTKSDAIGDYPVQGLRAGATSLILAELKQVSDLSRVVGFLSTSIDGNDYNAYWLAIPGGSLWVFNFSEGNWTKFSFPSVGGSKSDINSFGVFNKASTLTIAELVGKIQDQTWTPATLTSTNPLDSMAIGFADSSVISPSQFSFSSDIESPATWSFSSFFFAGDKRHQKAIKKVRVVFSNPSQASAKSFNVNLVNESGESQTQVVTVPGLLQFPVSVIIVPFSISGMYFHLTVSGTSGGIEFSEITPIYDIGGEQRS